METLPTVSIKKIFHRDEYRIGIYFLPDKQINEKVKALNPLWSKTHKCWYISYSKENYKALTDIFPVIEIIKETDPEHTFQNPEPGIKKNHDNAPIVLTGELRASISPVHKEETSVIETYQLRMGNTVGKYWILYMKYSEEISQKLLQIKGVYWHSKNRAYMIIRNISIKVKVEALLGVPDFLPNNYYSADVNERIDSGEIIIQAHVADKKYMQLMTPPVASFIQQIKRLRGSKYSKTNDCYLLPATPDMLKTVCKIAGEMGLKQVLLLKKGYLNPRNNPNQKSINLQGIRERLLLQSPVQVNTYVTAMIDYLMALNYSHNTIKNYTQAFLLFLRRHQYQNPDELEQRQIVRYLAGMMEQGLSSSTAHTLVNALLFYYRNVLKKSSFEINIPRPKKEKKLPQVLTMPECLGIFKAISNPKHKLLMMLGYGAGLRLSEIVSLEWKDIHFDEFKIHIKGAKGHKDRLVMLPYSIVTYLQQYRTMFKGEQWVFEGQNKGEPYSSRSVQQVMQQAIVKSGLEKKATVHTLRHSFATHLLEAGTDIRYIQQLLGHNSILTTTIYTHITAPAVKKIQSPLDNMVDMVKLTKKGIDNK